MESIAIALTGVGIQEIEIISYSSKGVQFLLMGQLLLFTASNTTQVVILDQFRPRFNFHCDRSQKRTYDRIEVYAT